MNELSGTVSAEENVRTVHAPIMYLAENSRVNRRFVAAGIERSTGTYEPHVVPIRDGRSIADCLTLDTHGFQLFRQPPAVSDFSDKRAVDLHYAAQARDLVQALTGASHVAVRGWMIRTAADLTGRTQNVEGYDHKGGIQPPAGEAHVDYSPQTAPRTAAQVYAKSLPDGKPYSRFIAFSLWRPLTPPPQNCPLALCDGRSLDDGEGVTNPLHIVDALPSEEAMMGDYPGEEDLIAASVFRYRPEHRWWYFSNMSPDEFLLFKFFDSDHSVAWRCPHSAFFDTSLPDAVVRESIETRLIAYFD
jgi:hypothetical protein